MQDVPISINGGQFVLDHDHEITHVSQTKLSAQIVPTSSESYMTAAQDKHETTYGLLDSSAAQACWPQSPVIISSWPESMPDPSTHGHSNFAPKTVPDDVVFHSSLNFRGSNPPIASGTPVSYQQ